MSFNIILGDITKSETEAIVNAANTSLLGGGGVDGAIHRAAGPGLLAECRELHGCKTGQAKITKGYGLKARYVIHTPGPYYSDGRHHEAELLESCYKSCLELVEQHNIKTISFPSISTGIYRFPLREAAEIAVRTIHLYPETDVTMVCFDEKTKLAYEQAEAGYRQNKAGVEPYVEYCNLPMKTAFQNTELAEQVSNLGEGMERSVNTWKQGSGTFRQMACLGGNATVPSWMRDEIMRLMSIQDQKNPYPLTRMYPYLLKDAWTLDMREVSYMKVDLRQNGVFLFSIKKIAVDGPEMYFYSWDQEGECEYRSEEAEEQRCLKLRPADRGQMLGMIKCILLDGTLDLGRYEVEDLAL